MTSEGAAPERGGYPWLFGARTDLAVFLGSAILSLALLALGWQLGLLHQDSPEWIWVPAVLAIDVAHVWSTIFRVYLDSEEFARRRKLYIGIPIVAYALGVAAYSVGPLFFWRCAAYLAVYHFVRQQYGWVAMYRRRAGEDSRLGRYIDTAAIYAATLYPLIHWHAHLPREFWWFVTGDFASPVPTIVPTLLFPLYVAILATYAARSLWLWRAQRRGNPGKDIVVVTTALCWHLGIVTFNSDYAFTVTNVVIHGVPYFALVYFHARRRAGARKPGAIAIAASGPVAFVLVLIALAYGEELFWDRLVWQERSWLFGDSWGSPQLGLLVPLLALPQLSHYLIDGFVWRKAANREYFQ